MYDEKLYNSPYVANRIKAYAKAKDVSLKSLLESCNLGSNTFSHMLHGRSVAFNSLACIADYLNCSVDYLLGRTEEPSILSAIDKTGMCSEDMELIKKYRRLPESLQTAVNQILNSYDDLQSRQATNEHLSTSENNAAAKTNTISEDAAAVVAEGEKIFGNVNINIK